MREKINHHKKWEGEDKEKITLIGGYREGEGDRDYVAYKSITL